MVIILGAGITGITAGFKSGSAIYETTELAGGICYSYYMRPGDNKCLQKASMDKEVYRFEIGGGHWIFGADRKVLQFIRKFTSVRSYSRRSAVYFSRKKLYVPYPLQNNLRYLDKAIARKALDEIPYKTVGSFSTMKEWLMGNFGPTLCEFFFFPFHNLYTAGLYEQVVPQDEYKSPVDSPKILKGAGQGVIPAGYNAAFVYPEGGFNVLAERIAENCSIHYRKKAVKIDIKHKKVFFADGSAASYSKLISTLPLNKMIEMTGLKISENADPYTSVLVLNIGAVRGKECPDEHWLYISDSKSGFHRVGFYSNVEASFLPKSSQGANDRVSIYVERTYPGGQRPHDREIKSYIDSVIRELQDWGFIKYAEAINPTWIDVAYTWSWPRSQWKERSLKALKAHDVYQAGRYGRWVFQGIADSIREGLKV